MSETRSLVPSLQIRDAAFDAAHAEKYCLVLQAGEGELAFAVLDNIANRFLAFEKYVFPKAETEQELAKQIEKLSAGHEWLSSGFKRADALVITERFTLVPSAFFDTATKEKYIRFNHPGAENETVLTDTLTAADARNIFAVHVSLERALKKISPSIRIRHQLTPLINLALSVNKNRAGRRALAHASGSYLDVVISEGGKLLLANTYRFRTGEDFIYYLLFACEQLKLNPEKAELLLAGNIEPDSAAAGLAKKYVRNVNFATRPVDAHFAVDFEKISPHRYYSLFALHYHS